MRFQVYNHTVAVNTVSMFPSDYMVLPLTGMLCKLYSWAAFAAAPPLEIRHADVPWPPGDSSRVIESIAAAAAAAAAASPGPDLEEQLPRWEAEAGASANAGVTDNATHHVFCFVSIMMNKNPPH